MSRGITGVLLGLAAFGSALFSSSPHSLAADRALIIGVNQYPHISPQLQLTGAVNDARMMERVAREVWGFLPENIRLLLNHDATSRSIVAAIENWLIEGTQPGDRVLLTYSGHGYFQRNFDGTETTGFDQTLAPHDVQRVGAGYINMISDDEIGRLLQRLAGREVMLIIDSCHSGTITRALDPAARQGPSIVRSLAAGGLTRSLDRPAFDRLRRLRTFAAAHPHVMTWTAAASTELAEEDMSLPDEQRLGVFTRALAQGLLERRADVHSNGVITAFELIHHVRRSVNKYCDQHRCRTRMTPTLEQPRTFSVTNLLDWQQRGIAPSTVSPQAQNEGGPQPPPPATSTVKPPALAPISPQEVLVQENTFGVRLELLPGSSVKLGQEIKLRVTSPQPGYLVVLDVRDKAMWCSFFQANARGRNASSVPAHL
jgi:hypothetical protein